MDEAHGHRGPLSPAKHLETVTEDKIHFYLLRKLPVIRPNQVWAIDITCIPPLSEWMHLSAEQ